MAGLGLSAQVAQYSKVFTDPVRNRQINTVIYHPQTDPDPGQQYPYIVFGHGWIMNHSLYQGLTNTLVPQGYRSITSKASALPSPLQDF